jgi:hypothetical protein
VNTNEFEAGAWIKSQVEDATGLTAWLDLIPESEDLPAIRYQVQYRDDVQTVAGHIAISKYRFLVVATVQGQVIKTGPHGLVSLAEAIDAALHLQSGVRTKARIGACTRRETYGNTENIGADVIRHGGGIYEVIVYGLPESE